MVDVTDATFETEVLARSEHALVVVDLWAEWCGPCKSLGPILERVVASTNGAAVLAKVDVDANPAVSRMFQVQSIPAVFAVRDRKVVDAFVGAQPEPAVADFVRRNLPADSELEVASLIDFGDEVSLRRALEIKPGHVAATLALAKLLVETDRSDEGLSLLATVPESMESRHIAALARTGAGVPADVEAELDDLLTKVKEDEDARQRFLDLLELLGPSDERTPKYRRRLTSALF